MIYELKLPGNKTLEIGKRTLIMGILNVTPDSFSDGGKYDSVDAAVERALIMVSEGADLIDVGGESTRPGAPSISLAEELDRVIPVIEALSRAVSIPITVDTYKAEVARQALEAGAHVINDVWGLQADPKMANVAAYYQCPVILMHNRKQKTYHNFINDVIADLQKNIQTARNAGIRDELILLDPGFGFAKTLQQNLHLMNQLDRIVALGFPVVLGTSRKSMIQRTLNLPANDVIEGTAATVALGIAQGCQLVRVHDIREMKRVATMTDAICREKGETV